MQFIWRLIQRPVPQGPNVDRKVDGERMSPRPREKILANLDTVFREAYQRAKALDDKPRMTELDASYQREQLILEVLLDIRDAIHTIGDAPSAQGALDKLQTLRKLTRL
jgi:hypothetical protein